MGRDDGLDDMNHYTEAKSAVIGQIKAAAR